MDLKLKDKCALVLGASQGIGKAVARSLAEEGTDVSIVSRSEIKLRQATGETGANGYFVSDLTQRGAGASLIGDFLALKGRIDILVVNTGGPQKNHFLDVTIEQWEKDFQSLYISAIEILHEAIPAMQKNGFGRVIFITSIAAKEALDGLTTSNGIRPGLAGLCRSLANEFSADGLTFNCLLPGYTNTERIQNLNLSKDTIRKMVPAGRLADPRELGDLVSFLASEKGAYITAQSIAVDGGALRGL